MLQSAKLILYLEHRNGAREALAAGAFEVHRGDSDEARREIVDHLLWSMIKTLREPQAAKRVLECLDRLEAYTR